MHAGSQARGVATVADGRLTVLDVNKTRADSGFGEYFEKLMRVSGFANPAELGRASGIDPTSISRWIRGERPPTLDRLIMVAPHLGVRAGDLVVKAGLATREELGMIGDPPAAPEPPELRPVEHEIRQRLSDPTKTARHKRALENHLQYSLELFDEVVAQVENSPREPRMRRRDGR
jgi:transcriptional regulator with XRE-family HTH domain